MKGGSGGKARPAVFVVFVDCLLSSVGGSKEKGRILLNNGAKDEKDEEGEDEDAKLCWSRSALVMIVWS